MSDTQVCQYSVVRLREVLECTALSTYLPSYPALDHYGILMPVTKARRSTICIDVEVARQTPPATPKRYKHHRFPAEIIRHGVWLYYRYCLSYRDVEELLFVRGVPVSHEAIRQWCQKFGQGYAHQLRRRRPRPGDIWHLDDVFLTIHGERHYLWRAVDQDGNVLDILVQRRWNKQAAKKFFRKLLKGLMYVPRVIITDKLQSYGAAKRERLPGPRTRSPSVERASSRRRRTCHRL